MSDSRATPCSGPAFELVGLPQLTVRVADQTLSWDWEQGSPEPRSLASVRRPSSSEKHRHVPVHAHCCTTGSVVLVESGLEHELLLDLDRDRAVVWLVAQPFRLHYRLPGSSRRRPHTPDLLSLDTDGQVTVWDARPTPRQDSKFQAAAAATRRACDQLSWDYQIHHGHGPVRAGNLRWLSAYRHPGPWVGAATPELRALATAMGARIGDVLDADHGAGHLTSALWHLCWTGSIGLDLDQPLTRTTPIVWAELHE
ncbi:TnsA-like heteromeric transposase endonuclease subunit [Ornithinimicrobium panacihumi]|uniref:TnsA-like heteromeric transposase endonuclease subunit n=1 Tax=Ornithinimicrobium panacihumi TaxID=2008449 RepID=UPI003F8AD73D